MTNVNNREWTACRLYSYLLCLLMCILGLPSARAASSANAKPKQPLLTVYFSAFHGDSYGALPPFTPDNIKTRLGHWYITEPAVAAKLARLLASSGGDGEFNEQRTRLLVEFADGHSVLVDDRGTARAGSREYVLPPKQFTQLSNTLEQMREDLLDASEAARERSRPALARAVDTGNAAVVSRLLEHGASVDARDRVNDDMTPLMLAAYGGYDDLCRLLLSRGAAINAQDRHGLTALAYAAMNHHPGTARLFLTLGERASGRGGGRAVGDAAHDGQKALVVLLLGRGAPINTRGMDGMTPLMNALSEHESEIAALLIRHGADVNAADEGGFTPLMYAARAGDERSATLLLDRGVRIDADTDPDGISRTALATAVLNNHPRMVSLLLARGASFSYHGDGGSAMMKEADGVGNPAITQILLRAGAKR